MTGQAPHVSNGQWIRVGNSIDGYIFNARDDGSLEVGYYQNRTKAIKETVVWNGLEWEFKHSGPDGSYLRGSDEALVKRGPRG